MADNRQPGQSEMYHMKPIHQVTDVEISTRMYPMKSLHESEGSSSVSSSASSGVVSDPDMKTLVEKDKKIASDLVTLTEEVKEMSRRLGHTFGETSPELLKQGSQPVVSHEMKTSISTPNLPEGIVDLVLSVSVAQPAFSAVLIGEFLKSHGVNVATVTQKHSSLTAAVPDDYLAVTGGLSGRLQHNVEKLVFTFVWKEEPLCPSLMHSPQLQTRIIGDASIGRYLCRILCPQLYNEDDVDSVGDIDKWIDTSVQMSNGSSKEKDAALKAMNSHLGKNEFFCNHTLTLADVTLLASLLVNKSHVKTLPKNVKKWFSNVSKCFQNTISRFDVPSAWTVQ